MGVTVCASKILSDRILTNCIASKYLVQNFNENSMPDKQIKQITGHKIIKSTTTIVEMKSNIEIVLDSFKFSQVSPQFSGFAAQFQLA